MPTCVICGTEITKENRVKSHGITNATFLKSLQGNSPDRLLGLNTEPGKTFDPYKYVKESNIICATCDHKIGKWEEEREKLFSLEKPDELFGGLYTVMPEFDSSKIKLACMADVLRCSLFHGKIYDTISLGKKHEDNLIRMIRDGDSGTAKDYTVMIGAYRDKFLSDVGCFPKKIRLGKKVLYETVVPRGWLIWIKVDSQDDDFLATHAIDSSDDGTVIANFDSLKLKQRLYKSVFTAIDNTED